MTEDRGNISTPDAADLNVAARRYAASQSTVRAHIRKRPQANGDTDLLPASMRS